MISEMNYKVAAPRTSVVPVTSEAKEGVLAAQSEVAAVAVGGEAGGAEKKKKKKGKKK